MDLTKKPDRDYHRYWVEVVDYAKYLLREINKRDIEIEQLKQELAMKNSVIEYQKQELIQLEFDKAVKRLNYLNKRNKRNK